MTVETQPIERPYDMFMYHPVSDGATVLTAHKVFFENYKKNQPKHEPSEYWKFGSPLGKPEAYTRVGPTGIPLTVRYGRMSDFSPEYLAVLFDSAGKTFMDDEHVAEPGEREQGLVRQVGWTITENRLISVIEHEGTIIAGIMGQTGSLDQNVGEIVEKNKRLPPAQQVGTIRFNLPDTPTGQELATTKDTHLVRATKYFRIPEDALKGIVPKAEAKWDEFRQQVSGETQIGLASAIQHFNETGNLQYLVLETHKQSVKETYTKHYGGEDFLTVAEEDLWPRDVIPNPKIGRTWWAIRVPIPQLLEKVAIYDELGKKLIV